MKTLLLVRHARAATLGTADDFARPLTTVGEQEATWLGEFIKKNNPLPECILTSPSVRTFTTAQLIAQVLNVPRSGITTQPKLYQADAHTLETAIASLSETIHCAVLIAHNPGISQLVTHLAPTATVPLPTAGIVVVRFEVDHWTQVTEQTGTLLLQTAPTDLPGQ